MTSHSAEPLGWPEFGDDPDLMVPEPDPARRRYILQIRITSPGNTNRGPIKPRRTYRLHREVRALMEEGIEDPWEIAARLAVGVRTARRWMRIIIEEEISPCTS